MTTRCLFAPFATNLCHSTASLGRHLTLKWANISIKIVSQSAKKCIQTVAHLLPARRKNWCLWIARPVAWITVWNIAILPTTTAKVPKWQTLLVGQVSFSIRSPAKAQMLMKQFAPTWSTPSTVLVAVGRLDRLCLNNQLLPFDPVEPDKCLSSIHCKGI